MAKIAGCRVIGSAGSEEKLSWLRELGFDAVFDYHERPVRKALAEAAPDGIDIYFDNVGGDHLEAAIGAMRTNGRIVACGSVSRYNDTSAEPGPRNIPLRHPILLLQGWHISDHYDRFREFQEQAGEWVVDGRLRYRETVVEGIENASGAFIGLLRGRTSGRCSSRSG
jgi:NADPH-dependent curcumin reductase CurA